MKFSKIKSFLPIAALVIVNAFLLTAWLYFYFSIEPQMLAINSMRAEVKNKEVLLESRHDTKVLLDNLSEQKKKIDGVFLHRDSMVDLVENIEEIGRSAGVTASINSVEGAEGVGARPVIKISAEGDYSKLFKFLILLENLPNKVVVKSASWVGESGAVNIMLAPWRVNFDIILVSYEAKS